MTWTKLGDEFPADARDLSDAAFRTHVEALCWSNSRRLDLLIPKREVRRFTETTDPDTAVEELVATGWWQDCADAGWYVGCRFAEWQLERSVIEHRNKLHADRQRRYRMHRAGDHRQCKDPTACVTRHETRDETNHPGRDGSGRDGKDELRPGQEEQKHGVTCSCSECAAEREFLTDAGW